MKEQRGFTLVELLIGLSLSLFIVDGIYQINQVVKNHYGYLRAMASAQESARIALDILSDAIEEAGFTGCGVSNLLSHGGITKNFLPRGTRKNLPGSDGLLTRGMNTHGGTLLHVRGNNLTVHRSRAFREGALAIICDCYRCDSFHITHVTALNDSQYLTSDKSLSHYGVGAQVSEWITNNYFVADSGRRNIHGENIVSLFVEISKKKQLELVEGINQLKISLLYDKNAGTTVPAAVEINLLTRSREKVFSGPFNYRFAGMSHVATDGYFYQGWQRYVSVRQKS